MNIAITSASGNVGKSTITLNLGLMLNKEFENIKLFDCDERMETLKEIMELREKNKLEYIKVYSDIENIENSLEDRKTLNIYDLKGHLGQKEATILAKSDLVIVITTNEELVLKKTHKFCKDLELGDIKYIVLVNKFNDQLRSMDFINKMFEGNVFKHCLKDKMSYKKIGLDGQLFYDRKEHIIGLRTTKIEFENFVEEFIGNLENL